MTQDPQQYKRSLHLYCQLKHGVFLQVKERFEMKLAVHMQRRGSSQDDLNNTMFRRESLLHDGNEGANSLKVLLSDLVSVCL